MTTFLDSVLNEVSYRKQIARQHLCQEVLDRAGGVVDRVNIFLFSSLTIV